MIRESSVVPGMMIDVPVVATPRMADLSCVHRGARTRQVDCPVCPLQPNGQMKRQQLYACDAGYGECVLAAQIDGVQTCHGCPKMEPEKKKRDDNSTLRRLERFTPQVRNTGVLFSWPYGLGDWIMLGYMTSFLDPSNRYVAVGGGSGHASIFDGHPTTTPLYPAQYSISEIGGGACEVRADPATLAMLREADVSHVFHGLPELWGQTSYPFHSKPRARLPLISNRYTDADLRKPIPNDIPPRVAAEQEALIEQRLRAAGWTSDRRLCVFGRYGVTHSQKDFDWHEARKLIELMAQDDPRWFVVSLESSGKRTLAGSPNTVASETILHGTSVGISMRALFKFANLFIGVPSGPWCLSCLYDDFPTIAIWHSLWPSWYMEPKADGVNIIGKGVVSRGWHQTPGSFVERDGLNYPASFLDREAVTAQEVFEHAKQWL